jgi:hypothetical protein
MFGEYETGLWVLQQELGEHHARYNEFLVYEQRLRENMAQSRIYGDNPTVKSERAQIIDGLNELARSAVGKTFNAVCANVRHAPPPTESLPATPPSTEEPAPPSVSGFVYRGPLAPDSPLFRGRSAELAQLQQLCQGEVQSYAIVYGGRQTGKTSLLLRLQASLPTTTHTCMVDFQSIPEANATAVYRHIAQQVAQCLACRMDGVEDGTSLIRFLCEVIGQPDVQRFVLMLEELGALPHATCHHLANVLRSMFTGRHTTYRPLARLLIVLAGSVELFDLAATEVSTLQNICEDIYLSDLDEAESVALVYDVLTSLAMPRQQAEQHGEAIYAAVQGHPYLTQRLGSVLQKAIHAGEQPTTEHLQQAIEHLLQSEKLLRHLRNGLKEQHLLEESGALLDGNVRF